MVLDSVIRQISFDKGIVAAAVLGIGVAKGYAAAFGIETSSIMDNGTTFAGLFLQTARGAHSGLIEGISDEDNQHYAPHMLKGGVIGLGLGAAVLSAGYGVGYLAGSLSK